MEYIDLRSDTLTKPTTEMLEAMRYAELGDDVYGEDPTVNKLEEIASEILEKESALFVTSGTQANQIAVMAHTSRGDEIIVERNSHIYQYEVGGLAVLSGVQAVPLNGNNGLINRQELECSIRDSDIHNPRTSLICLENTHNASGGTVLPLEYTDQVCSIARENQIKTHLDGARLFNASIASGIPASILAKSFDSVQVCLSKGLCAPVGSILAGDKDFIVKARKYRKMLGGGMRQAGVIAAAGIIALTKMVDRLRDDHENAFVLASNLSKHEELNINLSTIQTNMIYINTSEKHTKEIVDFLFSMNIRIDYINKETIRLVTHKDVNYNKIEIVTEAFDLFFNKIACE